MKNKFIVKQDTLFEMQSFQQNCRIKIRTSSLINIDGNIHIYMLTVLCGYGKALINCKITHELRARSCATEII